jgi:post-segregation antitoxin (ccd killing protein)
MNLQECRRFLQHHAHHNPKSSTLAMLTATTLTFATFLFAITTRDERLARAHANKVSSDAPVSVTEAQITAMIENARNSTWRENLENAIDAHERFVLPNRNNSDGEEVPEYVQRIDLRSREILVEDEERRKEVGRTRFWR